MIGIIYMRDISGHWAHSKLGSIPLPTFEWLRNESFWLLPHVAQAMCWGEPVGSAQ